MERRVVHVGIASFAVAVERLVHPELRSRPVAVAPLGRPRSVVTAVSPEAWRAGIRAGMVVARALRFCRDLKVVPPDEPLYGRASRALCDVLRAYSPVLEPDGYGHAYLDLTGTAHLFGAARDTAWRVQREIRGRLRLDSAIGLAGNKMVSRIAALVRRPDGLQDVRPGTEADFLGPLPPAVLPGAGPPVRARLVELNVATVDAIARMEPEHLVLAFGRFGFVLRRQALGIDDAPVSPPDRKPGISCEAALAEETNDLEALRAALIGLCADACARLRGGRLRASALRVGLYYADRREESATAHFRPPTDSESRTRTAALGALERMGRRTRVRRMALELSGLARGPVQLDLFPDVKAAREARLGAAADLLRRRFGAPAVRSCAAAGRE